MVDLAKIRKKAKKGVQASEPPISGLTIPAAGAEMAQQAAPDPPATVDAAPESAQAATAEPPTAAGNVQPETVATAISKLERFKATAGQRRDIVVRTVTDEEEGAKTQLELLTFVIAGEQYAVDIETIVEIVTPRAVTRIPNADPSVVGIISLRGMIVTLVDVKRKLRHPGGQTAAPDPRLVVVEREGETIGFEVDRVLRVIKIEPALVEPHPVVHISEQDEAIRGVFRQDHALTILLDFDKLLDGRSLSGATA